MDGKNMTAEEAVQAEEGAKRELVGVWRKAVYITAIVMALFHVYILGFSAMDPFKLRIIHLQFVIIIGFLCVPGWKKAKKVHIIDIIIILMSFATVFYVFSDFDKLINRAGVMPTTLDVVFGAIAILTIIELTRRTTGKGLPILVSIFIIYALLGPYLPGLLWHKGYSLERIISFLFSTNGIYNTPVGATTRFVYLFVLFGAFLEISGTGKFFMDFAFSVAGKTRGGPAKVAVIASGLFGMINGTSTGNVVTTGNFTIPMMKKVGYRPAFAGAVESCASTGGQIMPPVMGAAAFLMVQLISVPYVEIMYAALIPALLYYFAIFIMVDMEAAKLGLLGLPADQIPPLKKVLKSAHLSIPLFVLLYFLIVAQTSIILAGLAGIASTLIIYFVFTLTSGKKINIKDIFDACFEGGKSIVGVSSTCAVAGIIMGILSLTGLGVKIASIVISLSQGYLLVALILTMVVCIFLGMGLPTIAAYAITASVVAPALIEMGVAPLVAHLFILYFASLSAITPPVCLASFAAAAIAKVKPMEVGFMGLRLGLAGFIIPFMFVYGPSLLLKGTAFEIITTTVTAVIGVIALAISIQGYLYGNINNKLVKALFFIAALSLIKPGLITDVVGLSIFVGLIYVRRKKLFDNLKVQNRELAKKAI